MCAACGARLVAVNPEDDGVLAPHFRHHAVPERPECILASKQLAQRRGARSALVAPAASAPLPAAARRRLIWRPAPHSRNAAEGARALYRKLYRAQDWTAILHDVYAGFKAGETPDVSARAAAEKARLSTEHTVVSYMVACGLATWTTDTTEQTNLFPT